MIKVQIDFSFMKLWVESGNWTFSIGPIMCCDLKHWSPRHLSSSNCVYACA